MEPEKIFEGCSKRLGVHYTREDRLALSKYIDEDGSGDVDRQEFLKKVTLRDYQRRSHNYLISEMTFIDKMLSEWYDHRAQEKEKLIAFIKSFDDSDDNKIQLDEF